MRVCMCGSIRPVDSIRSNFGGEYQWSLHCRRTSLHANQQSKSSNTLQSEELIFVWSRDAEIPMHPPQAVGDRSRSMASTPSCLFLQSFVYDFHVFYVTQALRGLCGRRRRLQTGRIQAHRPSFGVLGTLERLITTTEDRCGGNDDGNARSIIRRVARFRPVSISVNTFSATTHTLCCYTRTGYVPFSIVRPGTVGVCMKNLSH